MRTVLNNRIEERYPTAAAMSEDLRTAAKASDEGFAEKA